MNTLNNNTICIENNDNIIVTIHDHILNLIDMNDERMLERNTNNM